MRFKTKNNEVNRWGVVVSRVIHHSVLLSCFALTLVFMGCSNKEPEALGTLEWDRVNGRAVASESIVALLVKEGDRVKVGQPLLKIDSRLQEAQVSRLKASLIQAEWHLNQLEAGYRPEDIATAEAELDGAISQRKTMQIEFDRKDGLKDSNAVSAQSVDQSANSLAQAKAQERTMLENLKLIVFPLKREIARHSERL